MANIEQGLRCLNTHRYSIKQLLDLSKTAYNSFDLSKFTFDAARAGVIPSLGDCAISSRKNSATRTRISSSETTSTLVDAAVPTARQVQAPERRPEPPPLSTLAQQNTGFARFLKKHSSPTHQRVTAGGRIVPMESRHAPPPFLLTDNYQRKNDHGCYTAQTSQKSTSKKIADMDDISLKNKRNIIGEHSNPLPLINQPFTPCAETDISPVVQMPLLFPFSTYTNPVPSASVSNTVPPFAAPEALPHPYPSFIPGFPNQYGPWPTVSAVPSQHAVSYQTAGFWPPNDDLPGSGASAFCYNPPQLAQPILWAQNALCDWHNRYNELDQQLKALDRHRAMTSLTAEIANQRREIVQQRANSKNMVNLISSWLNLSEQVQPATNAEAMSSVFNADAPSYIPMTQQSTLANLEAVSTSLVNGDAHEIVVQKPIARSTRRPLPIVPPPTVQTKVEPSQKEKELLSDSPEQTGFDSWGVKLGSAPPDLQKQQMDVLDSIRETQGQSSASNSSQASLQLAPQGGFFTQNCRTVPEVGYRFSPDENDEKQYGLGQVPSQVKALYQAGLDALRKPKGTISSVEFSDGSYVEIEGQDLQYPDPVQDTPVGGKYWYRHTNTPVITAGEMKPVQTHSQSFRSITPVDQAILPNNRESPCRDHHGIMGGKENIAVTPVAHRKAATDAFLSRFNSSDDQHGVLLKPCDVSPVRAQEKLYSSTNLRQLPYEHEQPIHDQLGAVKLTNRSETAFRERPISDGYMTDKNRLSGYSQYRNHNLIHRTGNVASETLSNKGYSSVSIQHVNAIAHGPQHLDGTVEGAKVTKSIFSLVGKVKSPRLLRRTTANGGI